MTCNDLHDLGCAALEGYLNSVLEDNPDTHTADQERMIVKGYSLYCALELPYIDQEEWNTWVRNGCPQGVLSFQRT